MSNQQTDEYVSPWASCQLPGAPEHCSEKPDSVWAQAGFEASIFFVVMREHARSTGNLQVVDRAFRDAWDKCMTQAEFEIKYGQILSDLGVMSFAEEMEVYLGQGSTGIGLVGGDPSACQIDWQQLACFSYWMSTMTPEQRNATVLAVKAGGAMSPVCEAVMSDPIYFTGPTTKYPIPPKEGSKGLSTGQKVAVGAAAGLTLLLAGLAGSSLAS